MFSSCSLLLACKVSSVNLYVGATADPNVVRDGGLQSVDIPVGETAYFYATCEVTENPDELGIKWEFDLDGDGSYDDANDLTDYDELYASASFTYGTVGRYEDIKVQACLDDPNAVDEWAELAITEYCDVDAVGVLKVIKDDPGDPNNSGPLYAGVGATVDLKAIPDPNTAAFPGGEPTWEITSQPAGSDPNLSSSGEYAIFLSDPNVPGDYVVEATCGTSSNSITIIVPEIVSLEWETYPDDVNVLAPDTDHGGYIGLDTCPINGENRIYPGKKVYDDEPNEVAMRQKVNIKALLSH